MKIRTSLRLYARSAVGLSEILQDYIGGQCKIEGSSGEIYQGEIKSFFFPKTNERKVYLIFEWLCIQKVIHDASDIPQIIWEPLPRLMQKYHRLEINYIVYYLQRDENRVKIKARNGEISHFYDKEDPFRLVLHEGKYVMFGKLQEQQFKLIYLQALKPKQ